MTLPLPVLSDEIYDKFNACVHCGLCLPACPTYVETQDEADSPRGRIHLMKAAVDGRVGMSGVVFEHLDRCLVCRACETACPSGVEYHTLIEAVRPQVAEAVLGKGKHVKSGMLQWVVGNVLPYPKRMAAALVPLRAARKIGLGSVMDKLMPGAGELAEAAGGEGGAMLGRELASFAPAAGACRGQVILLRGCVGSVVSAGINAASVRVLTVNGFDVHVLPHEPCCGALAAHTNDVAGARDLARNLVEVLALRDADYVVSPIAGCSAQLKALATVLAEEGCNGKARAVAARVRDISELLVEVGPRVPAGKIEKTVTYHDPCHLAHAQRITAAPRQLLAMIPGLKVVSLGECDMCCGAAGPYSLNQPAMAEKLGQRKVREVLATGAQELITANVGCALQIARHLKTTGHELPVRHVVELLAEAYGQQNL